MFNLEKTCQLVIVGCCLSFTALASTIEYTPDEDFLPEKSWYTEKDWYPSNRQYPMKESHVKYRYAAPGKTVAPMRVVPPAKIVPQTSVPFPARIAPVVENKYPWLIAGSIGYTEFQQTGDSSGGALFGRFSIGKALYNAGNTMAGLELGVQNGNRMSIGASQATLDEMGSLPIWTTVKPMVDLLATVQLKSDNMPVFFIVKGGIAYRTWETERQSINNLSQVGGEVQLGIGIPIVKQATLSVLYQGVYGSSDNFTVNPDHSATVSNIPVQNGVLLSLTLLL